MTFQSKQILNATGYLSIDFTFKVMLKKYRNKTFFTSGTSKVSKNVKLHQNMMMRNAIYNGVKKIFPNTPPPTYQIIIMSYQIVYLENRYQVIEKQNKKGESVYYERWRDKEHKRTRYSKIDNKKEYTPEQQLEFVRG